MASHQIFKKFMLTTFIIFSGSCVPSFAHDHDRYQDRRVRAHNYIYYPSQQVYFSPTTNNWFWIGGNAWQVSARLPRHINLDLRYGGVPISLNTERPYFEHALIERTYGRPWRESVELRTYNNVFHHENWRSDQHHERRYERRFKRQHDRDEWYESNRHGGRDTR
jgi:hypothetical protein